MSGHRRVKDIEYEDDGIEYYGDEEYEDTTSSHEFTAEDREQMHQGMIKVKEALGSNHTASDNDIQEALWHYYYDIGKSVSYLKNSRTPPPTKQKKEKAASRFDKAAGLAAATTDVNRSSDKNLQYPLPMASLDYPYPLTAVEFFADVSWLCVPLARRGKISCDPLYSPGGLLGGSASAGGKPSKIAALAAARKQKEAEKRVPGEITQKRQEESVEPSILDRLRSKDHHDGRSISSRSDHGDLGIRAAQDTKPRTYPVRQRRSTSLSASPEEQNPILNPEVQQERLKRDLRGSPSGFARTMLSSGDCSEALTNPTKIEDSDVRFSENRTIASRIGSDTPMQTPHHTAYTIPYLGSLDFVQTNAFSGPSPDDMVMNAQAKGWKGNKDGTKQVNGGKVANGAVKEGSPVVVQEPSKARSKNLDVAKEFEKSNQKSTANFVVIGHVDHGKSTLMGRLLYDLKVIDQRSIDKLRKEADSKGKSSFALAWVMDQTSEERERGVTVDIAMNQFETDETRFTILDAPGHRDFIPNMIAGASQADFAVLVIDAGTNSFESGLRGQTKEHALLVRSMGVQRLIVAVNKMDIVDWSQDRFDEIRQQLSAFLTNANFPPKQISFVPCAGLTGANIVKRASEAAAQWYAGNTLLKELEASKPAERALDQPFRLTISDIFSGAPQSQLSISGRIEQGSVQVADAVLAMPAGEKATIRSIEVNQEVRDWAVAGQIATLHLSDIDPIHLRQGDVLCSQTNPIKAVKAFSAKILAFEHVTPAFVDCHRGRLHQAARVDKLLAILDKGSGRILKKKPRVVKPGEVARIRVVIEGDGKGIPLDVGGKVVLRSEGETLAAGVAETLE